MSTKEKVYPVALTENGINIIIAGLNELPAKYSHEMINELLALKDTIDNPKQEEKDPPTQEIPDVTDNN